MGRGGRLPQSDADAEVRERAKDARAPLRAPQAALLEARTDLPGLGLSVRASADVSQISVRAFAGLAGALALLLCCGAAVPPNTSAKYSCKRSWRAGSPTVSWPPFLRTCSAAGGRHCRRVRARRYGKLSKVR